ncbi:hypothetical protein H310_15033 [Aphanomyces invadans]|uniref:Uncharacterized protein n=1 Tax=Aphanomyces invadans TaxID=157072 RepID=A0A024T838_9STRA|nr:hypothetical protein H310_15033 [Aphanomyces invadans]ETV90133.1 hypothetical protein H310_15033 [Aphanomyces invadans]|eukprot:XP_008881235.1 hypothetical protein H310_15033 [Aphanomyces invadans]
MSCLDNKGIELFIVEALMKKRQFNRKKKYHHAAHFKKLVQDLRKKTR